MSFPFQNWLDPAKEIKKQIRSKFFQIILLHKVKIFREQSYEADIQEGDVNHFAKDRV